MATKKKSSKTPAATPAPNPTPDFQDSNNPLAVAQRNLQAQVNSGGITAAQAQAELARLRTLPIQEVAGLNANANPGGLDASPAPPLPSPVTASGIQNYNGGKSPGGIAAGQEMLNDRNISQQMQFNRPDEVTPLGVKKFVQGPNGEQIEVKTIGNVNPMDALGWQGEQYRNTSYIDRGLQAIAGEGGANNQGQPGILPQLRGMLAKPLDYSGFSPIPTADQFSADRKRVEDSLYQRFADVNEPQFEHQQQQFREQMANRGIPVGSEQYNRQLEQLNRAQNDARQAARTQAIGMGGQEDQRLYENSFTSRGQQIGEANQLRDRPLADMRGLLSMVNPLQMPQFNATAAINVPNADYAGLADNQLTRDANLESAKLGFANQMAIAGLNAESAQGIAEGNNKNNLDQIRLNNELANNNKPGFGEIAAGLGGQFFGGLLSGIGQNWAGSWFR